MHRFFVASILADSAQITDSEAHHLVHVLRLKSGEQIEVFDGCGNSATAVIRDVRRSLVQVDVDAIHRHERAEGPRLTVAAAPPKRDRLKWMIEKLTELGVERYIPLKTTRGVVTPRETRLERLQSTVIAACKQSGRQWLMSIDEPLSLSEVMQTFADSEIVIAHPSCDGRPKIDHSKSQLVLIGPEGGFTEEELCAVVEAGGKVMSWPETILRTETAAIAFATMRLGRG